MSDQRKVNTFDVLRVMYERNLDIRLSTLDNVTGAQKTKHGSKVTIGIVGDVVTGIATGRFCGGLLLSDRKQFHEIEAELKQETASQVPLHEKNSAQAEMIAGYIDLIGAAKDAGVDFWWEGKTARAAISQEILTQQIFKQVPSLTEEQQSAIRSLLCWRKEKWPQTCQLCNRNMESEADRTEWHGLGNCVPVCMTCMGSGSSESPTERFNEIDQKLEQILGPVKPQPEAKS